MTKKNVYVLLFVISALLLVGFVVRLTVDLMQYDAAQTSFPFYARVIERGIEFLLPSLVAFIAAIIVRRKNQEKE